LLLVAFSLMLRFVGMKVVDSVYRSRLILPLAGAPVLWWLQVNVFHRHVRLITLITDWIRKVDDKNRPDMA